MNHPQPGRKFALAAIASIAAIAGMGLPAVRSAAQAPSASPQLTAGPTYTSGDGKSDPKFPNVDVVFQLIGADGNPIAAKPGDLKLFSQSQEIGTASSIRSFDQTGYGLTAILALDASGSMRGAPINAIHASIAKFVNQARSQDKVAVITFADDTRTDVPFGASQSALTQELETVQPRGKFTRLYDGLLDALGKFDANQPKRRQLVVISDGHDEGSKTAARDGQDKAIQEVVLKAKSLGVVIDSIGLTKDRGDYLGSLQQLSQGTGGTYRRARSGPEAAQDLDTLIGQGIAATRATPVASFQTSGLAADNTLHSTQLRWLPGKLSATAFIQTPKANMFGNPWIWALGACFLAGVILLAVSWIGSRKSKRQPPAPAQFPAAAPKPPAIPPAPPIAPGISPGAGVGVPGRTPTMPDTGPRPASFSGAAAPNPTPTTLEPQMHFPSVAQTAEKDRSRTQLAVFFEAPDRGPYASIAVQGGDLAGKTIPMTTANFSIGAVAGNSLILPGDLTISGQHARLLWENSILKIEDSSSTNGTFVNSVRLTAGRHLLRPGDEVRIGQTVLVLNRI